MKRKYKRLLVISLSVILVLPIIIAVGQAPSSVNFLSFNSLLYYLSENDIFIKNLTVETYERHVQIEPRSVGASANQPTPVDVGTAGGFQFASGETQEELHFQYEVPDDWEGTPFLVEIDWVPDGTAIPDSQSVKWDFEYRAVAEGESIVQGSIATESVTYTANTPQYTMIHSGVWIYPNSTTQPITKQDHLYFRVSRDTGVANDFTGTVVATAFEILYNSTAIPTSN